MGRRQVGALGAFVLNLEVVEPGALGDVRPLLDDGKGVPPPFQERIHLAGTPQVAVSVPGSDRIQVSRQVPDWSGGTKIGAALKAFNYRWARQVLSRGALVAFISDGLDRGEIETLERECARLQRNCYRLMWINPLLGSAGYKPLARGMRAVLPYVDDFLPARNLISVERLADHILSVSEHRPIRRQIAA